MRDFLTSASKGDSIEAAAALEGVVWIQKVSALFLGCLKSQDILYIISDLLPSSRRTLQLKVAEDVSTLVKVKFRGRGGGLVQVTNLDQIPLCSNLVASTLYEPADNALLYGGQI